MMRILARIFVLSVAAFPLFLFAGFRGLAFYGCGILVSLATE